MTITILDIEQGAPEWIEARRGMLTASEMRKIITPGTLKPARNDKTRAHVYEIAAQRITGDVDPNYEGDDMLRGHEEEILAREAYREHYAPVREVGFIVRDFGSFKIGYSPDGLVGEDGLIECKSRRQRFQVETIATGGMPDEFSVQAQTGLLVSGRQWLDFISYSGGLPMAVFRIAPDPDVQAAILKAAEAFEESVSAVIGMYKEEISRRGFIPTQRRVEQEMIV